MKEIDIKYIKKACRLAYKAHPSPNPKVGALIVKEGKIIGSGYHKRFGTPHAEQVALEMAKNNARNATMYVTLEPCNHYGKTPPCTDAIIKAGIKKVVIGEIDPDPLVKGKGVSKLKEAGIEVELYDNLSWIKELYYDYNIHRVFKRPGIRLKLAVSLDGKIATPIGDSKWLTSYSSRRFVHRLRYEVDAIMIGKTTLIKDNPSLSPYLIKTKYEPIKIIIARELNFNPENYKLFKNNSKVIIAYHNLPKEYEAFFKDNPNIILNQVEVKDRKLELKDFIYKLGEMGIVSIMVEGGGYLATSLLNERLVDRIFLFISPKIIGADGIEWFQTESPPLIKDILKLKKVTYRRFENDILIKGEPEYV